jgi:hypothetical protein
MAFNPLDYLKNLVPEGTNMFGASPNPNLKKMYDMGLLGNDSYTDMLAKANKQSIFQGLLSSGLSYLAQPKNQGYGSALPYLAKAGLAGVQAAQNPFEQMSKDAMMNQQLKEMQIAETKRKNLEDIKSRLYTITPGESVPTNQYTPNTNTMGMDGSTQIAPDMGFVQNATQTTSPTMKINNQAMQELLFQEPNIASAYLGNQETLAKIAKLEAEAVGAGKIDLKLANIKPGDVTPESYKRYTNTKDPMYGNPAVLDGNTQEIRAKLLESNAKIQEARTNIYQNYGEDALREFDQRQKDSNFNNTNANPDIGFTKVPTKVPTPPKFNGEAREAESGFIKGNNNIPNHPNNVRLGNGDIITPTIYKTNIGAKQKAAMTSELNKIASQNIANLENIRKQRDAISSFVNEGGASEVTGFFDVNTIAMTGGKKANARAKLETINQKEFLNNYSAVKATGGGFGALSEREGERLERMGYNLTTEQSEEQLIQNLIKMDNDLARAEQRLMDGYSKEYGAMEGYVQYELSPISPKFMPKGSSQITVKRIN